MFDKLEDFCRKNGHCMLPCKQEQDKTLQTLATWVATQRAAHKKNKLLEDRMERLNSIGFVWVVITSFTWEERCDQLDGCKKHDGNCLAPSDRPLHSWVHTQKQRVSEHHEAKKESDNCHAMLTGHQRTQLIKLGVVGHDPTSRMQHFKHRLSEHATCIKDNDGAVDVPLFENDTSLCSWVESQIAMCQIPGWKDV
jgi:hypothetical protein